MRYAPGWLLSPLLVSCGASQAEGPRFEFVDVASDVGLDAAQRSGDPRRWYIPESNGAGAAWLDHDGDGDLDLFLGDGSSVRYVEDGRRLDVLGDGRTRLYRNDGDWKFEEVGAEVGADRSEWVNAVTVADADGDGDPDLYLGCFGPDVYLRNDGGRFVDATQAAGLGNEGWGAGATFGDANRDGELDLYVANYVEFDPDHPPLEGRRAVYEGVEIGWGPEEENGQGFNVGAPDRFWYGRGAGEFREATQEAGLELEKALCSYAAVFSDVDLDGWPDLLVANDLQPCNLFANDGAGRFRDVAAERGFATGGNGEATAAMGFAVADFDGDGDFDCLRTNFDMEPNGLHVNDGEGVFREAAAAYGLADASASVLGWGAAFFDAELDGDLDLMVVNGHVMPQAEQIGMHPWKMPTQFFEAEADAQLGIRYREVTERAGDGLAGVHAGRGLALADVDDDGDLDALVTEIDAPPRLLENRSAHQGHWLALRTVGRASNRDGLGARVTVAADSGKRWVREVRRTDGLYSSHDPRVHFGLGAIEGPVTVEIVWPSGARQTLENVELDRSHLIEEPATAATGGAQ